MGYLQDYYAIDISETVEKLAFFYFRNKRIVIIVNNGFFYGIVTGKEINRIYMENSLGNSVSIKDICNSECKKLIDDSHSNLYEKAALIFADHRDINDIPVINESGEFLDLISREQVFWKTFYDLEQLPRMNYAYCIYNAALSAKILGYKSVSVIEFGVAGGNGLVNAEFHAKEIERILNISIEVYGFDSGHGLPESIPDYRNCPYLWKNYDYPMNEELLKRKLKRAKLIIGDIKDTSISFFNEYHPAVIGCMLIDVDRYSSTLPILQMIKNNINNFLPRIYMYFDDILFFNTHLGESLAIKEFNQQNTDIKISPEEKIIEPFYLHNVKQCHLFSHKQYNIPLSKDADLRPLSYGII